MLRKKKEFIGGEIFRISLVIGLALLTYWSFVLGFQKDLGGSDARWYQYILHDAIIQLNHGIFPAYLEQSEFGFFGGPVIRAPYYLLFGQFINFITFHQQNSLAIQHLTVLLTALAASLLCYFLFVKLAPKLRWFAVAFSFFYISCPGVMGLIYRYDMYYSFMTIPFVPLILYGLIRAQQKEDLISYILVAVGLSLTWMAHPPIALWISLVCFIFLTVKCLMLRTGFTGLIVIGVLFLGLNLWQFSSILSMGVGGGYGENDSFGSFFSVNHVYAAALVKQFKSTLPGVLLPLQWHTNSFLAFLQLGYSLWLVVIASICLSFRVYNNFLFRLLLGCTVLLLLLLYPLPMITQTLWTYMPQFILTVTDSCPMERLYIVIAALSCFLGILILNKIYTFCSLKMKWLISGIFLLLVGWNIYQSTYFINLLVGKNNSWGNSNKIYFAAGQISPFPYIGSFDPLLKSQLLNEKKIVLPSYDNEQVLINKCFADKNTKYFNSILTPEAPSLPSVVSFNVLPNKKYLACIYSESQGPTSIRLQYNNDVFLGLANPTVKTTLIPFFINDKKEDRVTVNMGNIQGSFPINFVKAGIIQYKAEDLPIYIDSFTPYKATVTTPAKNHYLKLLKRYFPGYIAKVNGEKVPVLVDTDKFILIPLKLKGLNHVELKYMGISLMRNTLYLSSAVWLLVLISLVLLSRKKFTGES